MLNILYLIAYSHAIAVVVVACIIVLNVMANVEFFGCFTCAPDSFKLVY